MCALYADNPKANAKTIPFPLLTRLGEAVEERLGLHFAANNLGDLTRKVTAAAAQLGFADGISYAEWLLASPFSSERLDALAAHLTVGETYFFRDKNLFDILQAHVLPECIRNRQGGEHCLRLWSAGCATGEEPYSLAIVLSRFLAGLRGWDITLLATDVSPAALRKAAEGIYGEWSFRDPPIWLKDGFFERIDKMYRIAAPIREMVNFARLNLVRDPFPSTLNDTGLMDLIVCRNVLMYFSRRQADAVVQHLCRCLVDGGWLVVSPIEISSLVLPPQLRPVHFPGAVLYRREAQTEEMRTCPYISNPPEPATLSLPVSVRSAAVPEPDPAEEAPEIPEMPVARRIRLLADRGRDNESLALCEEALRTDKLDVTLHYLRATILAEAGRPAEAAVAVQRALYIDQEFVMGHFTLAHLLRRMGREKEANKHFEKVASLLKTYGREDIPREAEGLNAGRLAELVEAIRKGGAAR